MSKRRVAAVLAIVLVSAACTSFGSSSGGAPDPTPSDAQADGAIEDARGVDDADAAIVDAAPIVVVSFSAAVNGIAANDSALYWTEQFPGKVHRADPDGTNDVAFGPGSGNPTAIALGPSDVYWVEHGGAQHGVWHAALDGSGATAFHAITDASEPQLDRLAVTDNYVVAAAATTATMPGYLVWFNPAGNVGPEHGPLANPLGVARVGGNQVIWSESGAQGVYEGDPTTAKKATFETGLQDPHDVAFANGYGYWTRLADGAVERAKPGGAVETLSTADDAQPFAIVAAGDDAWWLAGGKGTLRRRRNGATTTIAADLAIDLSNGPPTGPQIAVTTSWVYVVAGKQIFRLPR